SPSGVRLVVLTTDVKHVRWFEALLPALRRLHPDLLLVDSGLLRMPVTPYTLADRLGYLRRKIWHPTSSVWVGRDCWFHAPEPITSVLVVMYQAWFDPKTMSLDRLPALASLKGEGIAVGVLQMPRSDDLERKAPNLIAWRGAEAILLEEQGIEAWYPPGGWPDAAYC